MGQDLFGNTELFMLHFIGYFFLVSNYYHTFISHKAYASNSRYYSLIMFFYKENHPLESILQITSGFSCCNWPN